MHSAEAKLLLHLAKVFGDGCLSCLGQDLSINTALRRANGGSNTAFAANLTEVFTRL